MTEGLELIGIALIAALLGYLLRQVGFKGASLISAFAALGLSLVGIMGAAERMAGLLPTEMSGEVSALADSAFKIVGVGQISGLLSDFLSEIGEAGVGKALLVLGRVEIFIISAPFILDMLELSKELLVGAGG